MNSKDFQALTESYYEIYENKGEPEQRARRLGVRLKRQVSRLSPEDPRVTTTTNRYLDSAEKLEKRTKSPNEMKSMRRGYALGEENEMLEMILDYLIQEGYADTLDSAEIILENMSEDWIEEILEAFVDPEEGENPSGRRPIDVVSEHPKKKVRKKAVRAMARQMEKEYGGKWRTRTSDPADN